MSADFLAKMAAGSAARLAGAREVEEFEDVWDRAIDVAMPPVLEMDVGGFGLIAECKVASPSEGALAQAGDEASVIARVVEQARAYVRAGASAISVLTEPEAFGGSLVHLAAVVEAVGEDVPVMRKDFLVADYQIVEARAAGAGGVLLIARMLDDDDLFEMLDLTLDLGMFALVEAFDAADLTRIRRLLITRGGELVESAQPIVLGLNCRNLADLSIDPARFASLRAEFPSGYPIVAESGLATAADAAKVAALGYDGALVGSALMKSGDPEGLAREMIEAGVAARSAGEGGGGAGR
jgi:indole-3-glycerol phosphate synthase